MQSDKNSILSMHMKCIIWLGNPGRQYENTRHNVGFLMVDMLRGSLGFEDYKDSKFSGVMSEWVYSWEKIIFLKPTTYMNLSGESVASIVNFYKLDPRKDILVISDDIDMEFAKIRYREKWSHGGQNGLRDIIAHLGTDEFARVKVGIGRHDHMSVSDWVLSKFSKSEIEILEKEVFPKIEDHITKWLWDSI